MAIVKCYDRKRDVTYVYESTGYFDARQGKYRYKRHLIGRLDPETGETVPTGPRGGYRPKKEDGPPETEWTPRKPGRKKKNAAPGGEGPASEGGDELAQAKETIRQLRHQLSSAQKQYMDVVKKYNCLADEIRRILPEHIQI